MPFDTAMGAAIAGNVNNAAPAKLKRNNAKVRMLFLLMATLHSRLERTGSSTVLLTPLGGPIGSRMPNAAFRGTFPDLGAPTHRT
jgi:hypothetical protein